MFLIINVETGQPVDVLADRTAETFAAWLKAHPGVEIICRDRGGSYAEGANKGAPFALQVADRWHLVHNLSKAVERAVTPMRRQLQPIPQAADSPAESDATVPPGPAATSPIMTRTRKRHADVHALLADGLGIYTIARRLNLDPKTVRRYADVAEADDLLHPNRRFRASVLDRFTAHLQRRCTEGETGTTTLLAEIRALGYRGGSRTLRRWLTGVRGPEPKPITAPAPPSTRDITGLIMRPGKDLTADERATLDQLCQRHEPLATLRNLAHRFTDLIRHRATDAAQRLDRWITDATQTTLPQLTTFANGLTNDRDAVVAGLTTPWSSGKVEGTVNKIKMLKRQMFGRANTDLLPVD